MKQNGFLLAILSLLIYHNSNAQYYQYYIGDPYSTTIVLDNIFTIPKPTESYQSQRMRAFAEGSFGLIRDDYSDHFRNPAYLIDGNKNEIFGDLGSIQDNSKFFLGGFIPIADKSVGISINLDGMRKNKFTENYRYNSSSGQDFMETYTNEYPPRRYGTRFSFSSPINSDVNAGASYHFLKVEEISRSSITRKNSDSLNFSDNLRLLDYSKFGTIHKIDAGTLLNFTNFVLDLKTTLLISSYKPKSQNETTIRSLFSTEYRAWFKPTDIDTRGGLISAVISYVSPDKRHLMRFLAQSGYTTYDIKGKATTLDTVSYTSGSTYKYITDGTREGDGYVLDIRSGCGYERIFSKTFVAYAAISVNYILHKTNISENGNHTSVSSLTTTTVNMSKSPSEKLETIDIRFPIALEYFYGDHVIFRGGFEPRYKTGETLKSILYSDFYNDRTFTYEQKHEITRNELSLSSNFGATIKHKDYGGVDLLFGNILTDTKFWSISLRVFI
ncbi:MAG: hypothetical protein Q8K98_15185 [Bacteroidota bacterium]|nr:hypothetical protein [Bacteroidota bacterium]